MRQKQIIDSKIVGKIFTTWGDYHWRQLIVKKLGPLVKTSISTGCSVKLDFYIHENRVSANDIDNLCKPVLDALTDAEVYVDDSCVDNLEATKIPININDPEGIHIKIWEWTPEHP